MAIHTGFSLQLEALKREFARHIPDFETGFKKQQNRIDKLQSQIVILNNLLHYKLFDNLSSPEQLITWAKQTEELNSLTIQLNKEEKVMIAYSDFKSSMDSAQQELNTITPENLKPISTQTINSLKNAPSVTTILLSINQLIEKQQHPEKTSVINKFLDGNYYYATKAGLFNFVNSVASSVVGLWNKTPYSTVPTQKETLEAEKSRDDSISSNATVLDQLGFNPKNPSHRIASDTIDTVDSMASRNSQPSTNTSQPKLSHCQNNQSKNTPASAPQIEDQTRRSTCAA